MENTSVDKRVWGPWATAGFGAVIIIVNLLIQMMIWLALGITALFSHYDLPLGPQPYDEMVSALEEAMKSYEGLFVVISTSISMVVCVGLILIIIKVRKGISIAEYLGLRRINKKTILVVLAISVGCVILSTVLGMFVETPEDSDFTERIIQSNVWPVLLWITLVIFTPILEETLFRGFLFEGFRQSRIGAIGAISLTALIWALFHIQYNVYGIGVVFLIGIIFGIVRHKTGSLWSPMIIHAFYNGLIMLLVTLSID